MDGNNSIKMNRSYASASSAAVQPRQSRVIIDEL
jgi:hypothetical protein